MKGINCGNWVMMAGVLFWTAALSGISGCKHDAPTGDAWRASNDAVVLTQAASANCPGAQNQIAAAKAAGDEARAAGNALDSAGQTLDSLQNSYDARVQNTEAFNNGRTRAEREADAAQKEFDEADAAYQAAEEERQSYLAQAMAAGLDTSDSNLNGTLDRMKAGVEVPVALARAAAAKAKRDGLKPQHEANVKKYGANLKAKKDAAVRAYTDYNNSRKSRDEAKVKVDQARADYMAKLDVAVAKTKASRAANAALMDACPQARRALQTPGSTPQGQDVYNSTKQQHQEPH